MKTLRLSLQLSGLLALSALASAQVTLHVDASVAVSGDSSSAAPYATFQEALATMGIPAALGSRILLAPGEYVGNFETRNYEVIGTGGAQVTILRAQRRGISSSRREHRSAE